MILKILLAIRPKRLLCAFFCSGLNRLWPADMREPWAATGPGGDGPQAEPLQGRPPGHASAPRQSQHAQAGQRKRDF